MDKIDLTPCAQKNLKCIAIVGYNIQIPTRIPEKIVVALFSGILVNSGILVDYTEVKLGTFSC